MENPAEFVYVLDDAQLPEGSMKLVRPEGIPVLLVKKSGQIFAVDDRCPHQGCALSHGTLDGLVVICPCHGWRFNLRSGEYAEDAELRLKKIEFKVENAKIYVKLED